MLIKALWKFGGKLAIKKVEISKKNFSTLILPKNVDKIFEKIEIWRDFQDFSTVSTGPTTTTATVI